MKQFDCNIANIIKVMVLAFLALSLLPSCQKKEETVTYKISYVTSTKAQDYIHNYDTERGCKCSFQPYLMSCTYVHGLPLMADSATVVENFLADWNSYSYNEPIIVYEAYAYTMDEDWGKEGADRCEYLLECRPTMVSSMDIQFNLGLIDENGHYTE